MRFSCLLPNLLSLAPQGAVHTTRLTNRTRLCASVSWGGLSALERTICAMPSASVEGIGRADAPPRALAQGFPALSNAEARPARTCDNAVPSSVEGHGSAFPESRTMLRDLSPDKKAGAQRPADLPGSTSRRLGSPSSLPEAVAEPSAERQFGVCGAPRACWQNGAMTPNQVSRKTSCFAGNYPFWTSMP